MPGAGLSPYAWCCQAHPYPPLISPVLSSTPQCCKAHAAKHFEPILRESFIGERRAG